MDTIKTAHLPVSKEHHYELVKHDILIAQALPPYASRLYEVLLYHFRMKQSSYPGYEALMRETGIRSKSTISKYLKLLEKVGLIQKKNRRGFNQSNLYFKKPITNNVKKQLARKSHWIIEEIAREDEERRQKCYAKKMLDVNRTRYETKKKLKQLSWYLLCLICPSEQKYTSNLPHIKPSEFNRCEVHQMDSKRISTYVDIQTPSKVNRSGSIKENFIREEVQKSKVSTIRIQEAPKGLTKIEINLPLPLQNAVEAIKRASESSYDPGEGIHPIRSVTLLKQAVDVRELYFKLDMTTHQIETEFADEKHRQENRSHTRNLYERAKSKGLDDLSFIEQMYFIRGIMREMLQSGKMILKKMAYFYRVLENRLFPTVQMQG